MIVTHPYAPQVAAPQYEAGGVLGGVGKVLNEVVDVGVVGVEEDERLEPPVLQRVEVVPLHLLAQPLRLVVRPRPEDIYSVRVSVHVTVTQLRRTKWLAKHS